MPIYNHTVPSSWYDHISPLQGLHERAGIGHRVLPVQRHARADERRPRAQGVQPRRGQGGARAAQAVGEGAHRLRSRRDLPGLSLSRRATSSTSRAPARCWPKPASATRSGNYDPSTFPQRQVEVLYNTAESNRVTAEFMQAQWRQNLGITVQLRNMEFRTFLGARNRREYRGIARAGWVGDYMDPVTFLDLFSTPDGNNGTGWFVPEYAKMLSDANREPGSGEALCNAREAPSGICCEAQPIIPLLTSRHQLVEEAVRAGDVRQSGHAFTHGSTCTSNTTRRSGTDPGSTCCDSSCAGCWSTVPIVLVVVSTDMGADPHGARQLLHRRATPASGGRAEHPREVRARSAVVRAVRPHAGQHRSRRLRQSR